MPEAKRSDEFEFSNARSYEPRPDELFLKEIYSTKTRHFVCLQPRGAVLFAEGERARGVYILRSGSASMSVSSSDGRVLILRIARAGDVLGLNSVLRGSPYATSVKTLEPSRTDFISEIEFRDLLVQSSSFNKTVLSIVSKELADLGERAKSLLLSQTTTAKLAKLLLDWCSESEDIENGVVRINEFTHEQIAQMIGSSRETVTRLIASFRKRQIISTTPDGAMIIDHRALEASAFGSG